MNDTNRITCILDGVSLDYPIRIEISITDGVVGHSNWSLSAINYALKGSLMRKGDTLLEASPHAGVMIGGDLFILTIKPHDYNPGYYAYVTWVIKDYYNKQGMNIEEEDMPIVEHVDRRKKHRI